MEEEVFFLPSFSPRHCEEGAFAFCPTKQSTHSLHVCSHDVDCFAAMEKRDDYGRSGGGSQ